MSRELIWNREILSYILDAKYNSRIMPVVLGGTSGSGGGSGGPPGGYVGQIPQSQVCGDTTESFVYTTGSMASLLNNLNNLRAYALPAKNFFATQTYPLSNTISISAGEWYHTDGLSPLDYASGTSPTITAPVGGSRYDLLTINTTGDLSWISGAVALSPVLPTFPSAVDGVIPLWAIYSRTSGSVITNVDDGTNHYIQRDYRPFIGGPTVFPSSGSAYVVYRWQIDGPLSADNDFNGVYYIPDDYTLTNSVEWVKIPPSSGSVITDIQYSTNNGAAWTSVYTTLPTLTSGSFLSHDPDVIKLAAGTLIKANINNPGVGASTISLNLVGTVRAVSGVGTVGSVSVNASDGIIGSVSNPSTVPTINLHLADITPDSVVSSGSLSGINLSGINTGDQTITLTGDATGAGTSSIDVLLSPTGVAPGTYTLSTVTINDDGRILVASSGSGTAAIYQYQPLDVAGASDAGISPDASAGDHVHRGVGSVSAPGGAYAYGNIVLESGAGVVITQTSGSFLIEAGGSGGGGHVILSSGSSVPARPNLNFSTNFSVTDDIGLDATSIDVVVDPDTLASVAEANAGIITDKAVTPEGLPLRVENGALIHNQPYGGDTRGANAVDFQSVRAYTSRAAKGDYSAILSGQNNVAGSSSGEIYNIVVGGLTNQAIGGTHGIVGGGSENALIAGDYCAILGGLHNATQADYSFVGGGYRNSNTCSYGVIGGGDNNVLQGAGSSYNSILGGSGNQIAASLTGSSIGGGDTNYITSDYASIPGGQQALSSNYGQVSSAAGPFDITGDAQGTIQMVARREIIHATTTGWQDLYLDGTSIPMTIPTDTIWTMDILVSAADIGLVNRANYRIVGAVSNLAGATQVDAQAVTDIFETNALWNVRLAVTGATVIIQVTDGSDTETIRWVATIRTCELTYPAA